MVLLILRILLLVTPLLALVLWLKHRAKSDRSPEELDQDVKSLNIRLGVLVIVMLGIVLALYVLDDRRAPAGQVYIPPHMENGVLVQGRFVDKEEAERLKRQAEEKAAEKQGKHPSEEPPSEQTKSNDGDDGGDD